MNALKRMLAAMAVLAASFLPAIGLAETYNDGTYTWSYTIANGEATIDSINKKGVIRTDEVVVTFDPKGGSAAFTTKTYKTGVAYGELPSVAERPGCEFLGWFTAAQGGRKVEATNLVDFMFTELYAQWTTDLNTALDNKDLVFVSGGPTGWTGQSGESRVGIAAAASGFLDYNETNSLSTTVTGKGVLSFWWKTDDGDGLAEMDLALTVDGRTTWLGKPYKAGDGWLNFALTLTNDGPHTVTWSAAVDSTEYNEWTAWGIAMPTLAELIASLGEIADLITVPGAWIDQVVWTPDETMTDIVKWGDASWQAKRFLPGKADQMIAKCDARIKADAKDYEAHIRRAIAQIKKLGEDGDGTFAALLARYGYEFSGELMAFAGELDFTDAPLSNDAVDTVAAKVLPTLGDILADLETVPQGWKGCVALSPEHYPVDEPVYVDYADVTLAKAVVRGAKAAILAAQGYDLTVDNQKAQEELVVATKELGSVTVAESTGDWAACPKSRMKGFGADGFVQLTAQGKKLLARLIVPTDLPPECTTAECMTGDFELEGDLGFLALYLDDYKTHKTAFAYSLIGGQYLDGVEIAVLETKTEIGYDLEFDLSPISTLASPDGFCLAGASLAWTNWGEEDFGGTKITVAENVFELVSDGKIDNPDFSFEAILAAHPKCAAAIRDQKSLTAAKGELRTALEHYGTFDAAVRSRTTDDLHFFEYDPLNAEQWDAIRDAAKLALAALDEVVTVKGADYACFKNFKQTNLNERVTLKPFFDGKILRSLLPPFEGNRPILSSIPDITLAGTFPDWTMENQMYWLKKIDGVWRDTPVEPLVEPPADPVQPVKPPVNPPETDVPQKLVAEAKTHIDAAKGEVAPYEVAAAVYDGMLVDAAGVVRGTVQVKVAKGKTDKKNGDFSAKVTATVQLADGSKKISFKNGIADELGNVTGLEATGHTLNVTLGVDGLGGSMDGTYRIEGVRNLFSAKDADSKFAAKAIESKWAGTVVNVVGDGLVLSVSVAKKGKVKVSGTVAGAKVSASCQLLVGEDGCCVPVVITKKAKIAFNLWLMEDGSAKVVGLADAIAGRAEALRTGAKFALFSASAEVFVGLSGLLVDYLPNGVPVAANGSKWVVAGGAKAGKLVLDKQTGAIDSAKATITDNMSGLKLTYKAKDGSFKGSFKAYAIVNGKLKSYTANVTGVMVGTDGYGIATIKKVGSASVRIGGDSVGEGGR